ncbi:hypothetical protein ACRALDRAFT_212993 [Sodiomyces alcalophilus JCM 7366]|uniref:uncharacterized protein n=1 Tax=Sodiomyces alcalophilus JCM 7366 TaxID=591952 RepID=UPI0039B5164F
MVFLVEIGDWSRQCRQGHLEVYRSEISSSGLGFRPSSQISVPYAYPQEVRLAAGHLVLLTAPDASRTTSSYAYNVDTYKCIIGIVLSQQAQTTLGRGSDR